MQRGAWWLACSRASQNLSWSLVENAARRPVRRGGHAAKQSVDPGPLATSKGKTAAGA
jgi:hypothetical protein